MGKMKIYWKNFYPSIVEGIRAFIKPYNRAKDDEIIPAVYSEQALEEALTFLCLNDIQHQYTKAPEPHVAGATALITLNWQEEDGPHYMSWYEREENTRYYLLKYADNWADECDLEGFAVLTADELSRWVHAMEDMDIYLSKGYTYDYYFGTNEWIDYQNFEELSSRFTKEEISISEAKFLQSKFLRGANYFGMMPCTEDLENWIEDLRRDEEGNDGEN